jgi:hypothetical protein
MSAEIAWLENGKARIIPPRLSLWSWLSALSTGAFTPGELKFFATFSLTFFYLMLYLLS